jgi:hypothetical protein
MGKQGQSSICAERKAHTLSALRLRMVKTCDFPYGLILLFAILLPTTVCSARQYVDMGAKDDVAFYQPTVPFEVLTNDAAETFLGPETDIEVGFFGNELLLDTGASSIIVMNAAEANLRRNGFVTEGKIFEQGVAGFSIMDVSAPYKIKIAGTDGVERMLADTRIMSGQFPDLEGINGLVGMPGMVGRAVSMEIQPSSGGDDILDLFPAVDLYFADSVPAGGGHRYTIPFTAKSFDLTSEDTVNGDDPLPTQSPLPMLSPVVGFQGRHASGNFILDTGASISFISPRIATSLGLDSNGDGQFNDEDDQSFGTLPIGGIGGTVESPVFNIDTFHLATDEGVDLVWDSVLVLVLDIHPEIDGVLGSDVLTSGWVDLFSTSPDKGPIKQVLFDFTQFQVEGDHGSLLLDLDPAYDLVQQVGQAGDFDSDGDTDGDDLNLWGAGFGIGLGARLVDGDDNANGAVNGADFLNWQNNFSTSQAGDFDADGDVDQDDLSHWQTNFSAGNLTGSDFLTWQRNLGAGSSQLLSVPEPNGLLLALLACLYRPVSTGLSLLALAILASLREPSFLF